MRPPVDTILAPAFAKRARWIRPAAHSASHASAASTQALLVAFWDVCQPSSLRTLPYLTAWHERYGARGLRIVAAHAPSSDAGRDEDQVTAAVSALEIGFEVMLDTDFALWQDYENPGWPARYVLASGMRLVDVHFGEGGYTEAERAIQDLIGSEDDLVAPVRAIDVADAMIVVPSADQAGAYCGPYAAGEVWVDVASTGTLAVNGVDVRIDRIGAHQVVANETHVVAEIDLRPAPGLAITRTLFGPGIAP